MRPAAVLAALATAGAAALIALGLEAWLTELERDLRQLARDVPTEGDLEQIEGRLEAVERWVTSE